MTVQCSVATDTTVFDLYSDGEAVTVATPNTIIIYQSAKLYTAINNGINFAAMR